MLTKIASIRILLKQPQENVLPWPGIILVWFLTHQTGSSSMHELLETIGNSLPLGHAHTTMMTTTKSDEMKVAVDWYTHLNAFPNLGHGSSLDYHHGAFFGCLKIKRQYNHGRFVLRCIILYSLFL